MKRIFLFTNSLCISALLMAGGIVTNTNQSAMFTRMQARDATIGIDAVYFNPAGLTLLPNNGFYLSLNNQTLGQTRTITSNYQFLNNSEYLGKVSAPLFPGVYAAYKMDKFAFSVGFNPIGGGGGGKYDKGLPSFEYPIADLVPYLQAAKQPVTAYSMNANFEGSSVYFGYQANFSYQINDMISVSIGGRYVSAKEAYKGYLKDIMLEYNGTWTPAPTVFTGIATQATAGAAQATGAATNLNNAIAADLIIATDPLADPTAIATLTAFGLYQDGMTNAQAAATFTGLAGSLTNTAATATGASIILQDQEVDYEKTATGITPIISINIHPSDKLNIAIKYEHKTALEFTNKTTKDFTVGFNGTTPVTMFPDGKKARYDIPAQIVVGATFKPIEKLMVSTGFHYYMDKQADWEGRQDSLDANSIEFALGAEYAVSEKLAVSAGYLYTKSGVTEGYQSDLSFSLPSSTVGGGIAYKITPMIELNLAGSYTVYQEGEKNYVPSGSRTGISVKETYIKPIWIAAIGLNINFNAGK
jgi:long-chain fatty acid transport protein